MSEFLAFTLFAPLASWGEIAVGEVRGSWDRPSRSAILGLLAAALGLQRDNQGAHDALDEGYGVAVRLDAGGASLIDYHTTQTVAASKVAKSRSSTRAAALSLGDPGTILSWRAYRQDAIATVLLWARTAPRWPLEDLARALVRPRFVLYAGRKANVLGAPLAPRIVVAESLASAFAACPPGAMIPGAERLRPQTGWGREVAHDACDHFDSGLVPVRIDVRRDTAPHRQRWQFSERAVHVGLIAESDSRLARSQTEVPR